MRWSILLGIVCLTSLHLIGAEKKLGSVRIDKGVKKIKIILARRLYIVKCCGRQKCSEIKPATRTVLTKNLTTARIKIDTTETTRSLKTKATLQTSEKTAAPTIAVTEVLLETTLPAETTQMPTDPETIPEATSPSPTTSTTTSTSSPPTTTTTAPAKLECMTFNCENDPSIMGNDGLVNAAAFDGDFATTCGVTYYFSKTLKNWTDAASECCRMNMTLLSVETSAEQACISKMFQGNSGADLQDSYWTSGSDEFHEGVFKWCSTPNAENVSMELKFKAGEPNNDGGAENCIQSSVLADPLPDNYVLSDQGCSKTMRFICERPARVCPTPECPKTACAPLATKVAEAQSWTSNADGQFLLACNNQYFFSKLAKTKLDAESECCKYGMKLLTIESENELKCLSDANNAEMAEKDQRYWTTGSNAGIACEETWGWCNTNTLFKNPFTMWKAGAPAAPRRQNCAQLHLQPNEASVGLEDANCNTEQFFICKSELPLSPCPKPICTYACDIDTAKVALATQWKADADGVFRSACGKQYFISTMNTSKLQAETECCKYGLKLLSVESYEELACLADMNAATLKLADQKYWTSGTSETYNCVLNYGWCSTQTMFTGVAANFSYWEGGKPSHPYTDRCVQLRLDSDPKKMLFDDLACAEKRSFICEGDTPECTATCPANDKCNTDITLLNSGGQLLNVSQHGKFADGCDKTYMFLNENLNWLDAYQRCCKYEMTLVDIGDENELTCIYELNNNNSRFKFNDQFWTGGTCLDCDLQYKYCPSGNKFYRNDSKWLAGQPDFLLGDEHCVTVILKTGEPYTIADKAGLSDAECNIAKKVLCEGPKVEPCPQVACPDYKCIPDDSKLNYSKTWFGAPGPFRPICGRQYFISDEKKTWYDAYEECCKYGLKLVSLEMAAEMDCLYNAFTSYGWNVSADYWTSASSDGIHCDTKWAWCPNGTDWVVDNLWMPNEPSSPFVDYCGAWKYQAGNLTTSKLKDLNCTSEQQFICEGDVPPLPCQDVTLFTNDGKLKNAASYGDWKTTCGTTYVVYETAVHQAKALTYCCKIGMSLIEIGGNDELKCIGDWNNAQLMYTGGTFITANRSKTSPNTAIQLLNLYVGYTPYLTDAPLSHPSYFFCEGPNLT